MLTSAFAVLEEVYNALQNFRQTGRAWLLFLNKLPLTPDDWRVIDEVLGRGSMTIISDTGLQPARWHESSISGVWRGTMFDQFGRPTIETVEVGSFPQLAAAQPEDVAAGLSHLRHRLDDVEMQDKANGKAGE